MSIHQEAKGYTPNEGQFRIVNFWKQNGIEGATKQGTAKKKRKATARWKLSKDKLQNNNFK